MINKNKKLVFMGTPELAAFVFERLILSGYKFVALIAQPDSFVGRNKVLEIVPTKKIAQKYNIPVYQPEKIKIDYSFINNIDCDLVITLAYGQIVPQAVLDWPKMGAINLHASLLPKLRGAAPIQYSLINGESITGVSLMRMVAKMDAGEVYSSVTLPINKEDNYDSLSEKFKPLIADFIIEKLPEFLLGRLVGTPQDETKITFAMSIKPEQEHLNVNLKAVDFVNWVRGLSSKPGGYILENETKIKIYVAKVSNNEVLFPVGTIVKADKSSLLLQLTDGQVAIEELQKEGKKRLNYREYINGNPHLVGLQWK